MGFSCGLTLLVCISQNKWLRNEPLAARSRKSHIYYYYDTPTAAILFLFPQAAEHFLRCLRNFLQLLSRCYFTPAPSRRRFRARRVRDVRCTESVCGCYNSFLFHYHCCRSHQHNILSRNRFFTDNHHCLPDPRSASYSIILSL
jgi:hypothetical protein